MYLVTSRRAEKLSSTFSGYNLFLLYCFVLICFVGFFPSSGVAPEFTHLCPQQVYYDCKGYLEIHKYQDSEIIALRSQEAKCNVVSYIWKKNKKNPTTFSPLEISLSVFLRSSHGCIYTHTLTNTPTNRLDFFSGILLKLWFTWL